MMNMTPDVIECMDVVDQIVHLKPWEEAVGIVENISIHDFQVHITFDNKMKVCITTEDIGILKEVKRSKGKRVGILCTDNCDKRYLIRIFHQVIK